MKIDIDRPLAAPAKSLEMLIEEIGKSEISELPLDASTKSFTHLY
jgi:hypothetical protein